MKHLTWTMFYAAISFAVRILFDSYYSKFSGEWQGGSERAAAVIAWAIAWKTLVAISLWIC